MTETVLEVWGQGNIYEQYVGRWSRQVARKFLDWLDAGNGLCWSDFGCGSGALTAAILAGWQPEAVTALDRAQGFVSGTRRQVKDQRARFIVCDAQAAALRSNTYDAAVSGLVLNFVKEPRWMAAEMARVTRPGGVAAVYVWDYAGEMQMMRYFWDAAVQANPHDSSLDEGERFPICQPDALESLFHKAGLESVTVRAIDIETVFQDFADYWTPFLGGQGTAPTYLASLEPSMQKRIRDVLQERLPVQADGRIILNARAWAVRGRVG